MSKKALIIGITGQDGSYLAELLLSKGYEVHGLVRRSSSFNTRRLNEVYQDPHESGVRLHLHFGDLLDSKSLYTLISKVRPDEVYNLGAQSHVRVSFDIPEYTSDVVAIGSLRVLDAIKDLNLSEHTKVYQAGSSEMYGLVQEIPQNEKTPFYPRSPYAVSKVFAHWMSINYREAYNMFVCNGILFNHESPRRGGTFVSRKISRAVAAIKCGAQEHLYLGNLDAKRDWGYAKDYVEAMWLMLQQEKPDDFVIATGETHSVKEFVQLAFDHAGLDWEKHVKIDKKYFRPTEVDVLLGDPSKAKKVLGWEPQMKFEELVKFMVDEDIKKVKRKLEGISVDLYKSEIQKV